MSKKNIVVNGACGRMGKTICKMVINQKDYNLVGVCDLVNNGQDIYKILNIKNKKKLLVNSDIIDLINNTNPDLVIDFTNPEVVLKNIKNVLKTKTKMIVGTTGFDQEDLKVVKTLSNRYSTPILIAPNFAIGAVLMMEFSKKAAKYFKQSEIVELHHDNKMDAPSGTALKTAEMINENQKDIKNEKAKQFIEKVSGARGAIYEGVHIHSVRLQGLVAHQEVIFGGDGQTFKIRHDSINRESFIPGIKLAINKIDQLNGLVYGLDQIMDI